MNHVDSNEAQLSVEDLTKWNAKYADPLAAPREPSILLTSLDDLLPRRGRALDVAGGGGRHAIWLAQRGLEVTLCDISAVGLSVAEQRASASGITLETRRIDFETDDFPAGPWNVIVSFHFLQRSLFAAFGRALTPGGLLVFVQPTRRNLQRHNKPPERFLLADGELPTLVEGLEIIRYEEGWLAEGRHDAFLVARRPASTDERNV